MKKILLTVITAMAAFCAGAVVPEVHSLVLLKKNGETVEYKLSQQPVANFTGSDMNIVLALTGEKFSFPVEDVANLSVTPSSSGVEDAVAPDHVVFSYDGNMLSCAGIAAGTQVTVAAVNGIVVRSASAGAEGSAQVETGSLASGIYVVSAGNETFKFTK